MPPPQPVAERAQAHSDDRELLATRAVQVVEVISPALAGGDGAQWRDAVADNGAELLQLQQAAVEQADTYLDDVLTAQGASTAADGKVATSAFVDQTDGGGSWLRNLVYAPPSAYADAIRGGFGGTLAATRARFVAGAIVLDGVRDMARAADVTAALTRPTVQGYIRALRGATCARCAVLAGRHYRTGRSFKRHPRCDCYMIPSAEDTPDSWTTSPRRFFNRLSPADRVAVFGESGARAIEAGADISQVVNAYDGVQVVQAFGRDIATTTAGTTRRGLYGGYEVLPDGSLRKRLKSETLPPRLLPDEIFAQAELEGWTREETLTVLKRFGYVL